MFKTIESHFVRYGKACKQRVALLNRARVEISAVV